MTTDAAGNVYVTGTIYGPATFGNSNVTVQGAANLFVAKYDSAGSFIWVRHFGGCGESVAQGFGIAVDAVGHIYVAGNFAGALDLGVTNLNSGGSTDYSAFAAKCNPDGHVLWAVHGDNPDQANPTPLTWGRSIATDAQGCVYVAGRFTFALTFGSSTLFDAGYGDAFLTKFDHAGQLLWLARIAGDNWDEIFDLALDASGNAHLAGIFASEARFGSRDDEGYSTNLVSSGSADLFVAKYDTDGTVLWVRQGGAPDGSDEDSPLDAARALAVDAAGCVYVTGWFAGPQASFGTTNLTTGGVTDLFIAKYDRSGQLIWVHNGPGDVSRGYGIGLNATGNLVVAGVGGSVFMGGYDGSGNLRWTQTAHAASAMSLFGLAIAPEGSALLTGWYRDSIRFGATLLSYPGARAMFVAKLGSTLPPTLNLAHAGDDLTLSWPLAATGFELEATADLIAPAWSRINSAVNTNGTRRTVTVAREQTQQFYRLQKSPP